MRNYTFRKQTQQDFQQRVQRIDPYYFKHGDTKRTCSRPARPLLSLVMGFGWAYLIFTVARNRTQIEESLRQGALPAQYHDYIFFMLAGLLSISAVMLGGHLLRFLMSRRASNGKRNSGGLLVGALAAGALAYTPADVFDNGLGLLHENSNALILAASEGVSVDLASISFVSSNGLN